MPYVPSALRGTGYRFDPPPRPRGFCGLSMADRHRLMSGIQHASGLGDRALCETVLTIFDEGLSFPQLLDRLDELRSLDIAMIRAAGADRRLPPSLHLVPTP